MLGGVAVWTGRVTDSFILFLLAVGRDNNRPHPQLLTLVELINLNIRHQLLDLLNDSGFGVQF